jgi:hypothetical protein
LRFQWVASVSVFMSHADSGRQGHVGQHHHAGKGRRSE